MVLVTGPTGSGKTTTLYACLSEIQSVEDKIVTIEDPVEYQLRGITQIPVNEKKGLTFARGLRSILRHDPDKVMVGEIRDEETAQIAVQSALTGHLVFTTVHANNVVDVLGRFLNMKVELYNFVSALNCILAQRLVRKICPRCKAAMEPTKQLLDESGLPRPSVRGRDLLRGTSAASSATGPASTAGWRSPSCSTSPTRSGASSSTVAPPPRSRRPPRRRGWPSCASRRSKKVFAGGDDPARDQQGDLCRLKLARLFRTPPPPHAFALGADSFVYGRMGKDRQGLERVESCPLDEDWSQLGPVGVLHADRQQLAAALGTVLKRLEKPPARASLVVPNAWVRSIVLDIENLPRQRGEAEEVLRWRLKKLLPCRPEEVRLDWLRAGENGRVLVLLALEKPLAGVEETFAAAGVQIGRIEPAALALTSLLPPESEAALLATSEGRTLALVLVVGGRIALVRHKVLPPDPGVAETFAVRELARTMQHAREREGTNGTLDVWVASQVGPLVEFIAEWSAREHGVVMHRMALGAGRVPAAPEVEPTRLWALLASMWQGDR